MMYINTQKGLRTIFLPLRKQRSIRLSRHTMISLLIFLTPFRSDLRSKSENQTQAAERADAENEQEKTKQQIIRKIKNELANTSRQSASHNFVDALNSRIQEAQWAIRMESARRWRNRAYTIWNVNKEDYERTPDDPKALHQYARASRVYLEADRHFRKKATDAAYVISKTDPHLSEEVAVALVNLVNPFLSISYRPRPSLLTRSSRPAGSNL